MQEALRETVWTFLLYWYISKRSPADVVGHPFPFLGYSVNYDGM